MGQQELIENYLKDLNNLADYLTKLVSSYRLLVGAAAEYNTIALATKGEVKRALKRADKLGDVIDDLIEVFEKVDDTYIDYCKVKAEVVRTKVQAKNIEEEIENRLGVQAKTNEEEIEKGLKIQD